MPKQTPSFKSPESDNHGQDETPVLRVEELRKSFDDLEVIRGVSFNVNFGEVLSIIGASGSGKSTVLRCINFLEMPTSGQIYLENKPLVFRLNANGRQVRLPAAEINKIRREIGMVFQQFNLWPHLTVLQNVIEAPIRVRKIPKKIATAEAEELLAKIGLSDKRDEYPARLSGGQQQRVAITRALAMKPKVMLFDEPTSSLDPELTGEVLDTMIELGRDGVTMIVVTHEMSFAREASQKVIYLHEGLIEEEGPPERIFQNPTSERCRSFVSNTLR